MQQRRGRQGFAHCDRRSSRWRSASRGRVVATARNVADGPQISASDVIVVGEVSSVQHGRALIYDMNFDGTPPTKVPLGDPDAMYRSIEVTMSVNEIIGPSDGVDDSVTWETGVGPPSLNFGRR
jgi:hypothetical protein